MTYLELLAGKLTDLAVDAHRLEVYYSDRPTDEIEWYYRGKATGLLLAADKVRAEALEREGIDKEVSE